MSTDITQLPFPGNFEMTIFSMTEKHGLQCAFFADFISAVTVCNMNQAVKSVVKNYSTDSDEYSMIQSICTHAVDENVTNSKAGKWAAFQKLLMLVSSS